VYLGNPAATDLADTQPIAGRRGAQQTRRHEQRNRNRCGSANQQLPERAP
jgi:hypothetical protein